MLFLITPWVAFSQGPPITVETPIMLGLEGGGVRTFGKWAQFEEGRNFMQVFAVPYNVTRGWQIGAVLPFLRLNPKDDFAISGFGDLTLFTKYQIFKIDDTAETFRIVARISQSFQTGNKSTVPSVGSDHSKTYLGIILGHITTRRGIYGDLGYVILDQNYPDRISYNLSLGFPLLEHQYPQKQVNVFIEVNGRHVLNGGPDLLFVSPGLQWIPGQRILLETSLQLPLAGQGRLDNKQKFGYLLGVRFLLF